MINKHGIGHWGNELFYCNWYEPNCFYSYTSRRFTSGLIGICCCMYSMASSRSTSPPMGIRRNHFGLNFMNGKVSVPLVPFAAKACVVSLCARLAYRVWHSCKHAHGIISR